MNSVLSTIKAALAVAFCWLGLARAEATVLTFDSLAAAGTGSTFLNSASYTESGFTLSSNWLGSNPFFSPQLSSPSYAGSAALANNQPGTFTTLTKVGGGAFSITSIDLSTLGYGGTSPVTFVGYLVGGGTVSISTVLSGPVGFSTFQFGPAFGNLQSLSWAQQQSFHQFDNVSVSGPVPVPDSGASLTLLGMAFAGLVLFPGKFRAPKRSISS